MVGFHAALVNILCVCVREIGAQSELSCRFSQHIKKENTSVSKANAIAMVYVVYVVFVLCLKGQLKSAIVTVFMCENLMKPHTWFISLSRTSDKESINWNDGSIPSAGNSRQQSLSIQIESSDDCEKSTQNKCTIWIICIWFNSGAYQPRLDSNVPTNPINSLW